MLNMQDCDTEKLRKWMIESVELSAVQNEESEAKCEKVNAGQRKDSNR